MQRRSGAWVRALLVFSLSQLALACAPGADGEGYVLVDPKARAAGFFVELDGEPRSGPLPVAVPEGAAAVLNGPLRREEIAVAAGEVALVRGVEGRVERGATDLDQVRIRAAEGPARALAARIGAPLVKGGRDRWLLRGHDVLPIAALLEEAHGIMAIEPVHVEAPAAADAEEDDEALARLLQEESMEGFRSVEEQRQEGARIGRELSVRLRLMGPSVIEVGQRIEVNAELVNQGWGGRWVVKPGDGSEMGWREPYVYYTAEREASPGVWEAVPKAEYSRCGNYDEAWDKDTTLLGPGQALSLTERWFVEPETALDLAEPGRVRISAHYRYQGGAGASWRYNARVSVPEELRGTPAFEVVSEPLEVRIVRPLEAVLSVKGPLQVSSGMEIGSAFDLSLVNRSGEAIALPGKEDEVSIFLELSDRHAAFPGGWIRPKARVGERQALKPGESLSILAGEGAAGERGTWRSREGEGPLRVRAAVRLFDYGDARIRSVKSNWVEAPIAWTAP